MSRTIKFKLINDDAKTFYTSQLKRLYNTSAYYSENFSWILDKFWLGPGQVEPNMEKFQDPEFAHEVVNEYLDIAMESNKHFIDILVEGEKEGILKSIQPLQTSEYTGEIRVAGNEKLARIVIKALSEISLVFPKSSIEVEDEGHLLFTNLIIRKGQAIPDTRWVPQLIKDLINIATVRDVNQLNISDLSTIKYYKPDKQARLDGLKYIVKRMSKELGIKKLKFKDLDGLSFELWPDVEFYMRNVNISVFDEYPLDESKLLSGYFGEHWNLIDIDVEAESYRILADMQKDLKKRYSDFDIKVF